MCTQGHGHTASGWCMLHSLLAADSSTVRVEVLPCPLAGAGTHGSTPAVTYRGAQGALCSTVMQQPCTERLQVPGAAKPLAARCILRVAMMCCPGGVCFTPSRVQMAPPSMCKCVLPRPHAGAGMHGRAQLHIDGGVICSLLAVKRTSPEHHTPAAEGRASALLHDLMP